MAVQLQLTRKADGKVADLIALDDEICDVLGVDSDPVSFYVGWMDTVGLFLACGKTFDETRDLVSHNPERVRVVDYLETYFDNTSYGCR